MPLFSVTYDLIKEKNYSALIDKLNELDSVKVQLSQWLISINNTASEVKEYLGYYVDEDDKLMVIEFSKRPQFTKSLKGTNDWLNNHF